MEQLATAFPVRERKPDPLLVVPETDRRFDLAKAFGVALVESTGETDPQKVAAAAVGMADAVLAALKQE